MTKALNIFFILSMCLGLQLNAMEDNAPINDIKENPSDSLEAQILRLSLEELENTQRDMIKNNLKKHNINDLNRIFKTSTFDLILLKFQAKRFELLTIKYKENPSEKEKKRIIELENGIDQLGVDALGKKDDVKENQFDDYEINALKILFENQKIPTINENEDDYDDSSDSDEEFNTYMLIVYKLQYLKIEFLALKSITNPNEKENKRMNELANEIEMLTTNTANQLKNKKERLYNELANLYGNDKK